jgi:hypothetical protein
MADQPLQVILGVDTHAEVHVAAVLDHLGRLQVTLAIPTTGRLSAAAGLGWSPRPAHPGWGGGTGTYGAGLTRLLTGAGVQVIEVDRPNRQRRRRRGSPIPPTLRPPPGRCWPVRPPPPPRPAAASWGILVAHLIGHNGSVPSPP